MSNGRTEERPVTRPDAARLLDRTRALLEAALEADAPEEKDYAIRRALQYLVALEYLRRTEQLD